MLDSLATPALQVGDLVRVRQARRRDVHFTVTEVTPTAVTATNDRGGEARYEPDAFELVQSGTTRKEGPTSRDPMRLSASKTEHEAFADCGRVSALPGEGIESLLKRFKKSVQKAGVVYDLRRHEHFASRSQRRRQKDERARRRREAA